MSEKTVATRLEQDRRHKNRQLNGVKQKLAEAEAHIVSLVDAIQAAIPYVSRATTDVPLREGGQIVASAILHQLFEAMELGAGKAQLERIRAMELELKHLREQSDHMD